MNIDHIITEHYRHKKLTLKDGVVHDLHNEHVSNKQMASPEITVVAKNGFNELSGGEVVYSFRLTTHTDEVWRAILGAAYPEAPIKIEGDRLQITCSPSELGLIYDRTKKAIEQTNAAYKAAIPEVRRMAEAQDAARLNLKKKAEEHQKTLSDALDQLEI